MQIRLALTAGALALLTGLGGLAGCSSASDPTEPTGIDLLEIPTPSPDPDDFVETVDNPWLAAPADAGTVVVAGVTAVVVDGDLYAQDRGGNVWWFGRQGEWTAGSDGAQAGLWLPADPRVGDGWRTAVVPGSPTGSAEVVSLEGEAEGLTGLLVVDRRTTPGSAEVLRSFYESGTGEVVTTAVTVPR